ncbi:MAG: MoaD/ThiS family protein [Chloroflexi bacterium]|nr:MoaD/ThiS family protein [Chloroflexota bacterium]
MKVRIPSPLLSYTKSKEVEANGTTLADVFADLDRQYPGLRFRVINEQDEIREHIKIFVNSSVANSLADSVGANDEIHIITAISGGT